MKLLIYTQLWKRPEVTELCFQSIQRLQKDTKHETRVVAVLSEEIMIPICEKYGVDWTWAENQPLGRKHNIGLNYALKYEWDYLLNVGSDDIVSSKLLDLYEPYFQKGVDFFGIREIFFLQAQSLKATYCRHDGACYGAARVMSRKMLDAIKGRKGFLEFWPNEAPRGLDNKSLDIAKEYGFDNEAVPLGPRPYVVDIKTDVNIWQFDSYQGQEKRFDDLQGWFPENELQTIKQTLLKLKAGTMENKNIMKMYRLRRLTKFSTTFKEIPIDFMGGSRQPYFKGGYFKTSNLDIQNYLEKSPDFNTVYFLESTVDRSPKQVIEEPSAEEMVPLVIPPAPIVSDKEESIVETPPVIEKTEEPEKTAPVTDNVPPPEGKVVEDVKTVQEAGAWLRKEFPELKARDVNTKALVLKVAAERNIIFPNV